MKSESAQSQLLRVELENELIISNGTNHEPNKVNFA